MQNEEKVLPLFFSVSLRNNGVDNLCKSSVSAQTVHCIDWGQLREQKRKNSNRIEFFLAGKSNRENFSYCVGRLLELT